MREGVRWAVAVMASMTMTGFGQGNDASWTEAGRASLRQGLEWLVKHQHSDGSWSDAGMPALTALPLWAIAASGEAEKHAEPVGKAIAFLLSRQQPDGGIYVPRPDKPGSGLGNYNTSVCISALYATGKPEVMRAVREGRGYIAASQLGGDDWHSGGFGYDKSGGRRYSDLNNTVFSVDAMRRTQGAEDARPAGERRVDINWDMAIKYVMQLQNGEGETAGGFAYNMQDPKGGMATNASGRVMLRAYGSMSYAGLLAMIHARLDRSDPRVRSTVNYVSRFWTLEENPGQGQQGLFFYYNILSRALRAAGMDEVERHNAEGAVLWRQDLVRKLIEKQRADGSWINDNNRWWENDPVLVTSYALLTEAFALGVAE